MSEMKTNLPDKPKKITDQVMMRIQKLESEKKLALPPDYSAENALQSAWLKLQKTVDKDKRPVLSSCTQASVANSLLDMVIQGLNPAKNQCYFIAYGNELNLQRSYFGSRSVLRRIGYDVDAMVIWKGDTIERIVENARYKVTKHVSPFENQGKDIAGAYAIVRDLKTGEEVWCEMMTWDEIQKSWAKSKTYKYDNSTHRDFPGEMTKRTITERAIKGFINSRDDKDVLIGAFNRTTEKQYEESTVEDAAYEEIEVGNPVSIDDEQEPLVVKKEKPQSHIESGTPTPRTKNLFEEGEIND